jgi:hypothetical protein
MRATGNKYSEYVKQEIECSIGNIPDVSTMEFQPWSNSGPPTPFQTAVCAELNKLPEASLPKRLVEAFAESDTFFQAPCEDSEQLREALLLAICYFATPKIPGAEEVRKVVVWTDEATDEIWRALWRKLGNISKFEWKCTSNSSNLACFRVDGTTPADGCIEFKYLQESSVVDFSSAPVHIFDCNKRGKILPRLKNYEAGKSRVIVFNHSFDTKAHKDWLDTFRRVTGVYMTFAQCVALRLMDDLIENRTPNTLSLF